MDTPNVNMTYPLDFSGVQPVGSNAVDLRLECSTAAVEVYVNNMHVENDYHGGNIIPQFTKLLWTATSMTVSRVAYLESKLYSI